MQNPSSEPHPDIPLPGTPLGRLTDFADHRASLLDLPRDSGGRPWRLIVLREGERVHAFVNCCPHFGAPLAEQQAQLIQKPMASLTCNVHYARFDWADGRCARGPCEGEALTPVPVARDTAGALAVGPLRPG